MRKMLGLFVGRAVLDYVDYETYGLIRVCGWTAEHELPRCVIDTGQEKILPMAVYRRARSDLAAVGVAEDFAGFSIEFSVRSPAARSIVFGTQVIPIETEVAALLGSEVPSYSSLIDDETVWHREQIYGEGPPNEFLHPDVVKLALQLRPPILDFGCGSGSLIRTLRRAGKEAFGIELDRKPIRDSIRPDVADFIRLYDGTLPLPLSDGQFESVVASEVIEHIPDYEMALSEAARVCRNQFAITVPDMACLPYGHAKRCIPWHLLEATHVNFFNHRSLKKMLAPHFRSIQLFQIAGGEIEGTFMPGSLGAIATK